MKSHKGWRWFAIIWSIIIMVLSVVPAEDLPSISLWESDKLAHACVYFILTIAVINALRNSSPGISSKQIIYGALISVSYGIVIEFIQGPLLPTRNFDLYDILANVIGCIAGAIAITIKRRLAKASHSKAT